MVGIVIVAHSALLAEAAVELSKLMLRQEIPIKAAGGTGDPENPFGTNALHIQEAIEAVYSPGGVIVLMDMGSAILSAETALEFLNPEQRINVRLCEAPLVEGAIAAAVRSEAGGSLEEVLAEARGALAAKAAQLNGSPPLTLTREMSVEEEVPPLEKASGSASSFVKEPAPEPVRGALTRVFQAAIRNRLGIHARPAARMVSTAARFQSEITIRNLNRDVPAVSARSINSLSTLGVRQGHEILVSASGIDADQALLAIRTLVERNFDEDTDEAKDLALEAGNAPPRSPSNLRSALPAGEGMKLRGSDNKKTLEYTGIPVSPGTAAGPLVHYSLSIPLIEEKPAENPETEWQHLQAAIHFVKKEIRGLKERVSSQSGDYTAAIFDAHLLFLEDPGLLESVRQKIFEQSSNAGTAWKMAVDAVIEDYHSLDDPYMRARSADLADLKIQVLQKMAGGRQPSFKPARPAVLAAADLKPSDIARLEPADILGICTAGGTANSHSAILARSLGVPVVFGLGTEITNLAEGILVVVDGDSGCLLVNPENADFYLKKQKARVRSQKSAQKTSRKPALTADGRHIEVMANIGGLFEARRAVSAGAEGAGLLRTEFLFFDRMDAPSEEEQYTAYRDIIQALHGCPVTIRTLDAGGDKPLPYLRQPAEENPFLGERGIRLCLNYPEMFKTQLKAGFRAGRGYRLRIMFPMVSSVVEVRQARALLLEAQKELSKADSSSSNMPGSPVEEGRLRETSNSAFQIGIMIETPAAAAVADRLSREVDFFSIGSNDLAQYVMAADRNNDRVASLSDSFHPAVLRLVRQTIRAGHDAGIPVSICGEMAGQPLAIPLLLGMGIDSLSVNISAIAGVKKTISRTTLSGAEQIAARALEMDSAEEVKKMVMDITGAGDYRL